MRVTAVIIMMLNFIPQAMAGSSLAELEHALSGADYPHVLGAKVSVGREPVTVLLASKTPQAVNRPVDIRSATKSITALLFSHRDEYPTPALLDTPMHTLLADRLTGLSQYSALKQSITLRDALTMQSGLACDDWIQASVGHEDKMYQTGDWLKFWSSLPISHVPGEHFSYCTGNVIAAGQVLAGLQQKSIPVYAQETLFTPLGINNVSWAQTPEGGTDTGGHLKIGLNDMHKLGVLVLNRGRWGSQQIISPDWIAQITAPHSRVPERKERYGMLWWIMDVPVNDAPTRLIYAHGNGGNFIVVIPAMNVVAAFTGNAFNSRQQFVPLRVLVSEILPYLAQSG
ncbi:beta-lactamase family protein [Aestuariibacter halophilus]|uniref:Beta-lactamase family protein n=1 Tax=Fluctibacter halophilus TaxID=226011 RepID=A0ABS8G8V2_9ALTE|nr:serine hydrolase [Aestuariibacter halophilus]MCC2616245.1 beta-lactamase family protein [Aestuariibacter halophilus]